MVVALLLLGAFFSYVTWQEQHPSGAAAAEQLADEILGRPAGAAVLIVAGTDKEDAVFADTLADRLRAGGLQVAGTIKGSPRDARLALEAFAAKASRPGVIAFSATAVRWDVVQEAAPAAFVSPRPYHWPRFLQADNLRNITSQIAIIAILAVGMTLVIIAGGIDLSVGSLVALAAVVTMLLIRDMAGGEEAQAWALVACAVGGVAIASAAGMCTGLVVTSFAVPPFIVTLAMMFVARGLAFRLTGSQAVYQAPDTFMWLGRGADLLGVPNQVVLMALLFLLAHVLMTRMTLGRYIYAVGGNVEAARLSGVPVRRVLLLVYVLSGALAGLGGVVMASQLKSAAGNYAPMYELYVIAAVVVGGTSLSGGEGHVLGTLIGALIIAVIQNGMNLMGVGSETQMIVFGGLILAAVLLDALKRGMWRK
jgi:ribose transport system permease protein